MPIEWTKLITTFENDDLESLASVLLKSVEDKKNERFVEIELFNISNDLCLKDAVSS